MRSLRSRRFWALLLPACVLAGAMGARAQQPAKSQPPVPVLRKQATLVLVDVVVSDKKGGAVPKLSPEDFILKVDGKPQQIAVFSAEGVAPAAPAAAPPPLPASVYTNLPQYHPPREPLTIVLLDALNTPRADQVFMRRELFRYLAKNVAAGQWTALLALTDRLLVLQNFTTDREQILAALESYKPKESAARNVRDWLTSEEKRQEFDLIAQEIKACGGAGGCPQLAYFLSDLIRAENQMIAASDQDRMQRTFAALRGLAAAVLAYPGRKNLIWVSAGFPIFYPGERRDRGWSADAEVRATVAMLNAARLAVYPVDPRGLVPVVPAAHIGEEMARASDREMRVSPTYAPGIPTDSAGDIRNPRNDLMTSQQTMQNLATNTGGEAFYNRNDLSRAVEQAVADGAAYYTLGFYPKDEKWDGGYRRIDLKLEGKPYHLRYRQGYYAVAAYGTAPTSASASPAEMNTEIGEAVRAALADLLPPTGITFRAYVPPPATRATSPVGVEFWLDAASIQFTEISSGQRQMNLEFVVGAFSPDGKKAAAASRRVIKLLNEQQYRKALASRIVYPMSLDVAPGKYQLRLLVRDNSTGAIGRVDLPLSIPSPTAAH